MTQDTTEIEVEVVEIDGITPAHRARPAEEPRPQANRQDWRRWQGQISKLDSRWWPLWVFLGIIALVLALTVGVVIGVIFVIFRAIMRLIRAILG